MDRANHRLREGPSERSGNGLASRICWHRRNGQGGPPPQAKRAPVPMALPLDTSAEASRLLVGLRSHLRVTGSYIIGARLPGQRGFPLLSMGFAVVGDYLGCPRSLMRSAFKRHWFGRISPGGGAFLCSAFPSPPRPGCFKRHARESGNAPDWLIGGISLVLSRTHDESIAMLSDIGRSTGVDKAGNRREAVRYRNRSQAVGSGLRERDPKGFPRSLGTCEGRPGALRPQRQTRGR